VLWAYDYLRSVGRHQRTLVVAPLSALSRTWEDAIEDHFPHLRCAILHGERRKREALLDYPADVYITNFDGVKILSKALTARPDISLVIVDELPETAANARTDRWKHINWVVNGAAPTETGTEPALDRKGNPVMTPQGTQALRVKRRKLGKDGPLRACWGMTGTPMANKPTDAWAQARLVTPETAPSYFNAFKDRVMRQVGPFLWVPRDNAIEEVHALLQPSIRFTRDEIMDLPPTTWADREVELTKEQAKAYRQMKDQMVAEVGAGMIVAANEGVKVAKLIQIAVGRAYTQTGEAAVLPTKPRMDEAVKIVTESEGKVLIYVPYISALKHVAECIEAAGFKTRVVHGSVSRRERDEIFGEFQNQDELHVLVCQPDAMAHSLTLTRASTIVWFAPTLSAKTYEQACGRITRPGQQRNTFIIHLMGTDIERRIYKRLREKKRLQGVLLDMAKDARDA
jgi:SNF2 family DNA or RNA helicase